MIESIMGMFCGLRISNLFIALAAASWVLACPTHSGEEGRIPVRGVVASVPVDTTVSASPSAGPDVSGVASDFVLPGPEATLVSGNEYEIGLAVWGVPSANHEWKLRVSGHADTPWGERLSFEASPKNFLERYTDSTGDGTYWTFLVASRFKAAADGVMRVGFGVPRSELPAGAMAAIAVRDASMDPYPSVMTPTVVAVLIAAVLFIFLAALRGLGRRGPRSRSDLRT